MKKLIVMALGLGIALGSVSFVAADDAAPAPKKEKKAKKMKKAKKTADAPKM